MAEVPLFLSFTVRTFSELDQPYAYTNSAKVIKNTRKKWVYIGTS